SSRLMLEIHTGEIFHLQAIYPILNGFGLIGLLVTGMSMSGLFNQKKRPNVNN
ncbi:MAG: peptidase, partial [Dolichospermum sp.]|nr:peptidase [Dolichospermum sp.]